MTAELRRDPDRTFVIDLACGIEEDWAGDDVGARVRVDEHNEAEHPVVAAGVLNPEE